MTNHTDVIVVGSGLAGLSCAFALAKRGYQPLILEAGPVIGGRTSSWEEHGMPVDSGLHTFLGIYHELPKLLREAGVDTDALLAWVDTVEIHTEDGRRGRFGAAPYRHPLRALAGALGNSRLIPWKDKLKLIPFGAYGIYSYLRDALELDKVTVVGHAKQLGISDRVVHDVFQALTRGIFFQDADAFSAYAAFAPAVKGLKRGFPMGIAAFNGGMGEVLARPIAAAIERNGGEIRTSSPVTRLIEKDGRIAGVETEGLEISAHGVVLATSIGPAQALLRPLADTHPWLEPMLRLKPASAVSWQCELDQAAFSSDHPHLSRAGLSRFAEQSHTTFRHVPGRLSGILFPPEPLLARSDEEIHAFGLQEAKKLGIDLAPHITRFRIVRHPKEFYAMEPGAQDLRPAQRTPLRGFALAGDYTKQPFLASMEGAVISGNRAAEAIVEDLR